MEVYVPFSEEKVTTAKAVTWGGGTAILPLPDDWETFVKNAPGGDDRCRLLLDVVPESEVPEDALWYYNNEAVIPGAIFSESDGYGYQKFITADGREGITGPTNWGGNYSYQFWSIGGVRIQSTDRGGHWFKARDIIKLRAAAAQRED